MIAKHLPCTHAQLDAICANYPTPFYLYDERGLREGVRQFHAAFKWNSGFREFFAVKATPTPAILALLREEGCGMDCSSLAELALAAHAGVQDEAIMFSSNNTPAVEFQVARRLGAIINLDALEHIAFLEQHAGLPEVVSLRYNPGPLQTGNAIIGNPIESKFGVTREQLFEGYQLLRERGIKRFGLHAMVASNELNTANLLVTARMLFELAVELAATLDIRVEFVNIGGGIGISYRPEQTTVDLDELSAHIKAAYDATITARDLGPVQLWAECGRVITGPHGFLVARVRHIKQTYKRYAGLDATMADLMRPGIYGAYHHISVPGKEHISKDTLYDVTGSLCENNDKFAIDRMLPQLDIGDLVVIHDAGAHGRAMGFNYNGKLRPAELLLRVDGSVTLIRRAETLDDYFATLQFPGGMGGPDVAALLGKQL